MFLSSAEYIISTYLMKINYYNIAFDNIISFIMVPNDYQILLWDIDMGVKTHILDFLKRNLLMFQLVVGAGLGT